MRLVAVVPKPASARFAIHSLRFMPASSQLMAPSATAMMEKLEPFFGAALHGRAHTVDIIGLFRQQDDVCAACNAGVQRQPAGLVAHDLDAHYAAVAAGGGVDAVDDIGGNVHGSVETEGHVGAVDIVIDGLGQADDVQALLREQVCGFVGAIAAQTQQAVQLGFLVGLFSWRRLYQRCRSPPHASF